MYIHVYIHIYIYTYTYVYIFTHIHICIYMYIYLHIYNILILNQAPDFTGFLLAYTSPAGILQRKFDDRPINANDGSKMAGCNKSKTHVIRKPKRIFCTDTFHSPSFGPHQRKTCCKANMHLKKIGSKIIV